MILGKIIAGALAIVWDIESAFVSVNLGNVAISRATSNVSCGITASSANLTGCGASLSDSLVQLVVNGVSVLNSVVAALNLGSVGR